MYPPCRRWANSTAPKLLDYGYVQCDMQLWSLQGTPLYSGRTHNFYYFQHQHVSLLEHWTLSRGWKFEPMSRCQVIEEYFFYKNKIVT